MCAQRRLRSPCLIKVFALRMKKAWVLSYPLSTSKDSDQTGRMPRLIWVFAGRTCFFLSYAGSYVTLTRLIPNIQKPEFWSAHVTERWAVLTPDHEVQGSHQARGRIQIMIARCFTTQNISLLSLYRLDNVGTVIKKQIMNTLFFVMPYLSYRIYLILCHTYRIYPKYWNR